MCNLKTSRQFRILVINSSSVCRLRQNCCLHRYSHSPRSPKEHTRSVMTRTRLSKPVEDPLADARAQPGIVLLGRFNTPRGGGASMAAAARGVSRHRVGAVAEAKVPTYGPLVPPTIVAASPQSQCHSHHVTHMTQPLLSLATGHNRERNTHPRTCHNCHSMDLSLCHCPS